MVIMDTERLKARISHVLETGTPLVESAVDIALRRQFKIALGLGSLAIVGLFFAVCGLAYAVGWRHL